MSLQSLFNRLEQFLIKWSPLWAERPFHTWPPSWRETHPQLAHALIELDRSTPLDQYQQDRGHGLENRITLSWACSYAPELAELNEIQNQINELCPLLHSVSSHFNRYIQTYPHDFDGIRLRKKNQIKALISTLNSPPSSFLEWCGGKGHLASCLSGFWQVPAGCLEWNPTLTQGGEERFQKMISDPLSSSRSLHYHTCDALSPQALEILKKYPQVIALHACGPLHRRLIEASSLAHLKTVVIMPCCYSLDLHSQTVQNRPYPFPFDRNTLKLATLQRVVVSPQRDLMRIRSMALRLAFQEIWNEIGSSTALFPSTLPSLSRQLLRQDSRQVWMSFAQRLSTLSSPNSQSTQMLKKLSLLSSTQIQEYEHRGWMMLKARSPFEHFRHLFRFPLEAWLVLDRALALQNQGYQVKVDRFCSVETSPRNFRITAVR